MGNYTADQAEVTRASISEKLIMHHLIQLYSYDFTEFEDVDVDAHGLFRYDYFDE